MTNSHTKIEWMPEGASWMPVRPPKRGQSRTAFHVYMLLPGFSIAFHAATLGRSRTSIATYRAAAINAALSDPSIMVAVNAAIAKLSHFDGVDMAVIRGSSQLPYWSRMAICEFRKRGYSRHAIATRFRCSDGTIANVLQGKGRGYISLTGERRLSHSQIEPSKRWHRK